MTINLAGATLRQKQFIEDLLAKRDYALPESFEVSTPSDASKLIAALLNAPKKAADPKKPQRDEELFEALCSVPKSKYAVPTVELFLETLDEKVEGDLLFVEVKEYEKTLYLRRLHGSVGGFSRTRLSRKDSLQVLRHIAQDAYKYTKLFGEHYRCCGKCGAELTDAMSRQLQLGPECRKAFGF